MRGLVRENAFEYAHIFQVEGSKQVFDNMLGSVGVFAALIDRVVRARLYDALKRIAQVNRVFGCGEIALLGHKGPGSPPPNADLKYAAVQLLGLASKRPKLPATINIDKGIGSNQFICG